MKLFMGTDAVAVDVAAPVLLDREYLDRTTLEQQFENLLEVYGPALTRLAASYTNTVSDRDDLLQEIALAIWQGLPRFRGESSERTFLYRIAHNRAITFLSRARGQSHELIDDEIEVHDPAPGPESSLSERQRSNDLRQAVHRLPVAYRQVITLTLEGLGYREISEVLGISEANVGARLNRARQQLKDVLEKRR